MTHSDTYSQQQAALTQVVANWCVSYPTVEACVMTIIRKRDEVGRLM